MKCLKHATIFLGTAALIAVSLSCGAPNTARADAIVLVTVTNNTVIGKKSLCGVSGTELCTETLNESFEWDNSTGSYVGGSLLASVTGNFSTVVTSTTNPGTLGCGIGNAVYVNAMDFFEPLLPSGSSDCSPPLVIAPGSYDPNNTLFLCGGGIIGPCYTDFGSIINDASSGTITATAVCFSPSGGPISCAVPEPATLGLFGVGVAFLGLARHRRRAIG
jgi:hypothetical protein